MGRKRKVDLNLDEQMQDVQNEITKTEETLKKLRQQENLKALGKRKLPHPANIKNLCESGNPNRIDFLFFS